MSAMRAIRTTACQHRQKPLKEVAARRNQAALNLVDQQLAGRVVLDQVRAGVSCGSTLYRLPTSKEMP